MRTILQSASVVSTFFLALSASAPASAQTAPDPAAPAAAPTAPPPAPPVEPAPTTSSTAGSSSLAGGGGAGAGIGVGAAAFLSGLTALSVVYDMPVWHIEGLFGFASREANGNPDAPTISTYHFGARGWFHVHQGTSSDLSLGLGVGMRSQSGSGDTLTAVLVEPGMLARVFLTPNFAVHGFGGLSMVFGDREVASGDRTYLVLGTQVTTGFGFSYFFR